MIMQPTTEQIDEQVKLERDAIKQVNDDLHDHEAHSSTNRRAS